MAKKRTATKKTTTRKATAKKTPAKKAATKRSATGKKKAKLSALDAAAKVLGEAEEPLNAKQMIEVMAVGGYWKSPGGKTPHATLYAAITREIANKGRQSRFKKAERGKFTLR
jgi:hypothetical protein